MPYYLPEVEAARAVVFELIGRNVLRFQKLELLLKNALRFTDLRITDVDVRNGYKLPAIRDSRETLGTLAGRMFDSLVVPFTEIPPEESFAPLREGARLQIKTTMRHQLPLDIHAEAKARFKQLVEARNELIHQSLLHFDLASASGCAAALAQLEQQAIEVKAEIEYFVFINEMINDLIRYLKSPEAQEKLLIAFRESAAQPDSNIP